MSEQEPRSRCFLVYAVAPEGMSARDANVLLNEYIGQSGRGLIVSHDHFIGKPHRGLAVCEVGSDDEEVRLADPGPVDGWELTIRRLTFSVTATRFVALADCTFRNAGGT